MIFLIFFNRITFIDDDHMSKKLISCLVGPLTLAFTSCSGSSKSLYNSLLLSFLKPPPNAFRTLFSSLTK